MKNDITAELKEIFDHGIKWTKLEIEYLKLTASEKLVILFSTTILGALILLMMLPVFIMFLFALVGVFKLIMAPPLAYLTVGGIVLALVLIIFLCRKPLIFNPVAKFVTKLILEHHTKV